MNRVVLALVIVAPAIAAACYNDRDTLGYELHNKPDVQRALTGRFDRYPALYYKMRVARLRSKGTLSPDELDDLAVALARLGRNDEALAALATKSKLPGLTAQDRYRLFANRGTIEAHKWMHDGAKVAQIAEFRAAVEDIAEALRLNPTAHFGREGTQLEVLRWLMAIKTPPKPGVERETLSTWLYKRLEKVDVATSLSGLVMLGGAWESPDIALAIGGVSMYRHPETMTMALERFNELVKSGHRPLDKDLADDDVDMITAMIGHRSQTGPLSTPYRFRELRAEADRWHDAKERFMLARLAEGRHPDTDAGFWDGWTEPPMPVIPTKLPTRYDWGVLPLAGLLVVVPVAILVARDRWRKRYRLAQV